MFHSLLNDAVNNSDYTALNDQMIANSQQKVCGRKQS